MSTHTDGPWELDSNGSRMIVRAPYQHKLPNQPVSEGEAICQVYGPPPIREANAKLIAASPCLLAACRCALIALKTGSKLWTKTAVVDLEHAIAKVEGTAQRGRMS